MDGKIPRHIAIIMDGNGRWAKKRLMPRSFGHNAGMNRMISLADCAAKQGVKYLTVYALSTENIQRRPKEEIDGIYDLIRKYFKKNVKDLYKRNARVKVIGDLNALPEDVQALLSEGERNSPENSDFTLTFAINYGSRAEILQAVKKAQEMGREIGEEEFSSLLYTQGLPEPDLIIRTGGEMRLSNFLMYQAAYAELYFTDTLFPDFSDDELIKALKDFGTRERRFGKS